MADVQEELRAARAGLATALTAALAAVNAPNATAAMLGAGMQGVLQAQQVYNNTIARIPLVVMTDGRLPISDVEPEQPDTRRIGHEIPTRPNANDDDLPVEQIEALLESTNARKWADTFLAINKNRAIDRESLVGWFANAIETGRDAGVTHAMRVYGADLALLNNA